ncbi:signal peptide peptidase isoform X1 [Lycorma delicatula]|uniref:signal peptide peptidase isoform X1 n=1 Tax=Lycorma delicatula TaxID=130591 RepID=UPI003F518B93
MADVEGVSNIQLQGSVQNATNTTSTKIPATPEGMAVAYGSLVIMALLPIFFGAFRSVKHHKEQKESGEKPDTMSQKDAAIFPLIASVALFCLYIVFQEENSANLSDEMSGTNTESVFKLLAALFSNEEIFSKEYINLLLTGYFFFLGVLALCHLMSPVISSLVPAAIPNIPFHIQFIKGTDDEKVDLINYKFTSHDIFCVACCSLVGAWYLSEKHWIANNLFGLAFAVNGVELLHLNNVVTGCILLGGLFLYDIFWVFGTDVMVTVAKSFEAPIKLVFPQDLLEKGISANNFAMLGLGDIVVPGIFIALLLRFDNSLERNTKTYFYATFSAYFLGLLVTIFVMHMFKHAQPALLYLVPACLGTPLFLAVLKGDITAMFQYEDHPSEKEPEKSVTSTSATSVTSQVNTTPVTKTPLKIKKDN